MHETETTHIAALFLDGRADEEHTTRWPLFQRATNALPDVIHTNPPTPNAHKLYMCMGDSAFLQKPMHICQPLYSFEGKLVRWSNLS